MEVNMATNKNTNPEMENNNAAVENAAAEAQATMKVNALAKGMKAKLDKCPKVKIKIPIDKQNPKDKEVCVRINGYIYQIQRGVEVSVPAPVKKLLERGDYI